jgi:hypothetical protein
VSFHRKIGNTKKISGLKFINEYDVAFNENFNRTTIGGLSGIDFNPKK